MRWDAWGSRVGSEGRARAVRANSAAWAAVQFSIGSPCGAAPSRRAPVPSPENMMNSSGVVLAERVSEVALRAHAVFVRVRRTGRGPRLAVDLAERAEFVKSAHSAASFAWRV